MLFAYISQIQVCRQSVFQCGAPVGGSILVDQSELSHKRAYTRIGLYRGNIVAIKLIHKRSIDITRNIRKELKQVMHVLHNLCLYSICFQLSDKCLLKCIISVCRFLHVILCLKWLGSPLDFERNSPLFIYSHLFRKMELLYFSIDNARTIYTKKPILVKNEHARYTFERYDR
jgi:hypothetical protein